MKQRHSTLSMLVAIVQPVAVFVMGTVLGLMMTRGCTAQTVKIENSATTPHDGYVRTTTDRMPPFAVGRVGSVDYAVGRAVGLNLWVVDLKVATVPGQRLTVDLSTGVEAPSNPPPAGTLARWLGGPVFVNGVKMQLVREQRDGAGWLGHWRARHGRTFCSNLWLTYYPDQPAWCSGEVMVTSSNPTVTDTHEITPVSGIRVQVGDAVTIVPNVKRLPSGALVQEPGVHVPVIAGGVRFADGQGRAVSIVLVWPRHLDTVAEWNSARAASELGMSAVGIEKLLPQGNPRLPTNFNPTPFANLMPEALRRLSTWEPGVFGPNATSGDSGAQGDACFVGAEALLAPSAARTTYLSALRLAARPCHHLEASGLQQAPGSSETSRLPIMWDGRPHTGLWGLVDRRGKLIGLDAAACNGWWGPDVEHSFLNTLFAGTRLTGSPAGQWLMAAQARLYPKQWTTQPGWSTSQTYASRAVAWEAQRAVHLWRDLEDRQLAAAAKAHWIARWNAVIKPAWFNAPDAWVDIRVDDPRLGAGRWVISWQMSCASYFLDLAGEQFAVADARTLGLRMAKRLLADCWKQEGTRWVCAPGVAIDNIAGTPFNGDFSYYGMSLLVACVLRHEPQNVKARAIWQQLVSEATQPRQTVWLAPGVQ